MDALKKTVRWVFDYDDDNNAAAANGDKPVFDSSDEDDDDEEEDADDDRKAAAADSDDDDDDDDDEDDQKGKKKDEDPLPSVLKRDSETRSALRSSQPRTSQPRTSQPRTSQQHTSSRRTSSQGSSSSSRRTSSRLSHSLRASLRRSKKRDSTTHNNMEVIQLIGVHDDDDEDTEDEASSSQSAGSPPPATPPLPALKQRNSASSKRDSIPTKRSSNRSSAGARTSWRASLGRSAKAALGLGSSSGGPSPLGAIDEEGEFKQARLEDSNIAGIGSEEDRELRKKAAMTDKHLRGAGKKPGLQVWRVENKRTKSDTPDFGVRKWPKEDYGRMFSGDSYVVLNTYHPVDPHTRKADRGRLDYDVHFWLGKKSTTDEIGVAAIKTVELSALLDDKPVHHREVQGHESKLFMSYFKELVYMEGGHESGFRKVRPERYEPRLLMVRHTSKVTKAYSVPCKASSMNHGDCFVLDAGRAVYRWVGEHSNVFEKNRSGLLQHNIVSSRNGKAVKADCDDDDFWRVLGGSEADVRSAEDPYDVEVQGDEKLNASEIRLWRLSDASGSMKFEMEAKGKVPMRALDSDDVFIVHANVGIWVWIGSGATRQERASGMAYADKLIAQEKLSKTLPVTSITEEQARQNALFASLFRGK